MGINQAALKQKYKTAAAAKSMSAAARALKNVGVSDLPKSSALRDSRVRNAYAQKERAASVWQRAPQALADRQAADAFFVSNHITRRGSSGPRRGGNESQ